MAEHYRLQTVMDEQLLSRRSARVEVHLASCVKAKHEPGYFAFCLHKHRWFGVCQTPQPFTLG